MSTADDRYADELLGQLKPRTKAERAREKRQHERREVGRLIEAIRRRMSTQGNVTRAEILSEGFDEKLVDAHWGRACVKAGAHRIAST